MRRALLCIVLALAVGLFLVRERGLPPGAALLASLAAATLGFFTLGTLDRLRRIGRRSPGSDEEHRQQRQVDPGRLAETAEEKDEPERDRSGGEKGGETSHGVRGA